MSTPVDSPLAAMAVVGAALLGGMVIAWVLITVMGRVGGAARRGIDRARGADRPEWAPGIWHCAACLTTNHPAATRCVKCHAQRQELVHAAIEPRPDWIPDRIAVTRDAVVSIVHDPAAHLDPGAAHWRVTSGGQTVGSAARRDGALALLRALDGIDVIRLDVRGTGPSAYRLADVVARFEAGPFPIDAACPERSS